MFSEGGSVFWFRWDRFLSGDGKNPDAERGGITRKRGRSAYAGDGIGLGVRETGGAPCPRAAACRGGTGRAFGASQNARGGSASRAPRARERRNHAERPGECRPRASPRSALAPGRLPPPPRQLRRRGENSRRPVSASLAYAAFRRISGTSRSIFVIKMPYPVVGSLMSTWVTAPTNLPS